MLTDGQIWIIIPIYNAERTLKRCIQSVISQTYKKWNLMLVNDGSTDCSGKICDEYAAKDERIKVIHTTNQGSFQARVNGIKEIDDESLCMFCDSDDILPRNAITHLRNSLIEGNADMSCGVIQRTCRIGHLPIKRQGVFRSPGEYDAKRIMSELYISCFGYFCFPINLCGKLLKTQKVKRAMLKTEGFPHYFADDLNVMIRLLPELDKIVVIDRVVYRYRIGGGTSKYMPTFLQDNLLMYEIKKEFKDRCNFEMNIQKLIDIELKNIIVTYLLMCEKFTTYPHGTLYHEVEYVCNMKEIRGILKSLNKDKSGIEGINDALAANDLDEICRLIRNEVRRTKLRDRLKRILLG